MSKESFFCNQTKWDVEIIKKEKDLVILKTIEKAQERTVRVLSKIGHKWIIELEGRQYQVWFSGTEAIINGKDAVVEKQIFQKIKKVKDEEHHLESPMPGKIVKVLVSEGELVIRGQTLVVMEAMKMEYSIKSPRSAKIKKLHYQMGERIEGGVELLELE